MLLALSIVFGALVGVALGLTGGGGSLLAVPLLVYGLSIAPREAFGISLAAVGATAAIGLIPRIKAGHVEGGTGMLFAVAGMIGAPLGAWAAQQITEKILLALFSILMLVIASRMWPTSRRTNDPPLAASFDPDAPGPTCRRNPEGKLKFTTSCAFLLMGLGMVTGFLSGMFGVGGGFVIVPALVLFSGMTIHRAVATSLLVIVLVSISGVSSHFVAGGGIPLDITGLFVLGGVLGMAIAGAAAKRIQPVALQRIFAVGIVAVALLIGSKSLY